MKRFQRGFTLIELLAVIAIIGILAALILVSLSKARMQARDVQRKSITRAIAQAEESYFNSKNSYSITATDIIAFMSGAPIQNCKKVDNSSNETNSWFGNCVTGDATSYNVKTFLETGGYFECKTGGNCNKY